MRRPLLAALLAAAALGLTAAPAVAGCGEYPGADCAYFDLDGGVGTPADVSGSDLYLAQYVNATIPGWNLTGSFIAGANFTGAKISGSDLSGMNPGFGTSTATGTLFDSATITDTTINGNLQWTQFVGTSARGVDFSGAMLDNANFDAADLTGANFTGASLRGAQFDGAVLNGTNFTNADLSFANLDSAGADDAKFNGATMLGTQMTGMLADDTDFTGAGIFRADMSYVDLKTAKIDFYKQPTTALGPSWSYVSSFLPRIIDVAAYTCETGITATEVDSNDCTITISAIVNAMKDLAGLFTGSEEIEIATLVRKVIQDAASYGFDAAQPELEPFLNAAFGEVFGSG